MSRRCGRVVHGSPHFQCPLRGVSGRTLTSSLAPLLWRQRGVPPRGCTSDHSQGQQGGLRPPYLGERASPKGRRGRGNIPFQARPGSGRRVIVSYIYGRNLQYGRGLQYGRNCNTGVVCNTGVIAIRVQFAMKRMRSPECQVRHRAASLQSGGMAPEVPRPFTCWDRPPARPSPVSVLVVEGWN